MLKVFLQSQRYLLPGMHPKQPLSYLSFGGFSQTAGIIRFSRLDDVNSLEEFLFQNGAIIT
jgi:hypothetical protein